MRTTLKDIAEMAGVSRPAVSMVINNPETTHLSEEKKRLVLKLIKETGYRPNYAARQLRGKSMKIIGLIGTLFSTPIHTAIIDSIMKCFHKSGYQVILGDHDCNMHREMEIVKEFESIGVDGIILFNATSATIYDSIKLPVIGVSHNQERYDICTDLRLGGLIAGRHLIEHGHHRIGFVSHRNNSAPLRLQGLKDALAESGITYDPSWTLTTDQPEGKLSKQLKLLHYQGVSAFFTLNDYIGCRLMTEFHNLGISVPQEVAIIGFDGLALTAYMQPPLTTVVQPARRIGEECVKLMLRRIDGEPAGGSILYLEPRLHIGGSCGCRNKVSYHEKNILI